MPGADLAFVDLGAGDPPVLFVHGLGGQWRNWLENVPALAARWRAIAVDLPGFGGSAMPPGEISISSYARVLAGLLDALDIPAVVVVGNSMGGFVAAELALDFPSRVAGLVLVDAAGIVPSRRERWKAVPFLRAQALLGTRIAVAHRQIASRPGLRRAALRLAVHEPERLAADVVLNGLLESPRPGMRAALRASLSYLTHDWGDRLEQIRCPTLVVWGDADAIIPVRHAAEWVRRIPHARRVTIDGAGHVPMLERPAEFNRALIDFVAEVCGQGSGDARARAS